MLKRPAACQRQNQLDLALQELGRVERTLFMLDWLESPGLRQRCQAGLNKSEQRHALAQVICTFKQGRIADRGQEAQQFRASGLNLVIAAIVYWNSTYLADAVQHLRDQGRPVPDALLAHTSPLTWEHIGFSGDFLWWKKRLARSGSGKSGSYRAIIVYRRPREDRVLFTFCFAKNTASTLTQAGHEALAKVAAAFVATTDVQIGALLEAGDVKEVVCDGGKSDGGEGGTGGEGSVEGDEGDGGRDADDGQGSRRASPGAAGGGG